ncbi:hypothetical protein PENTCL1PPCAC_29966, partial [Pristionchus entomophagus]
MAVDEDGLLGLVRSQDAEDDGRKWNLAVLCNKSFNMYLCIRSEALISHRLGPLDHPDHFGSSLRLGRHGGDSDGLGQSGDEGFRSFVDLPGNDRVCCLGNGRHDDTSG